MLTDKRPRDVIPPLVPAIEDSELKLVFDATRANEAHVGRSELQYPSLETD